MGLFKSLLSSAGEGPDIDEEPPDVLRRSAVEAALDRMIAARAVEASPSVRPAPLPAHASTLATMSERRSGQDRRDVESAPSRDPDDRRSGLERRSVAAKPVPAAGFGRRMPRPT